MTETVNFPVTQSILPWTLNFNFAGPPQGLTVGLGTSRNARLEQTILDAVGSYGRQLGRIGEALDVLLTEIDTLRGADAPARSEEARTALTALRHQLDTISNIKQMQAE